MTEPKREKFQVAVVVFLEVEAVDDRDADSIAEHAIKSAIHKVTTREVEGRPVIDFHWNRNDFSARCFGVIELGCAYSNQLLYAKPTWLAYRDK